MAYDLVTLADARDFLKEFVESGTCDNTLLDARISEAEARLWRHANWRLSRRRIRARMQNHCFCLPLEVQSVLHVDIDGRPSLVFGQAYEYLNSGPGELECSSSSSGVKDLADLGEHPTQFDIPIVITMDNDETCCEGDISTGYKLVAFSPENADVGAELTIRGTDYVGDEIRTTQSGSLLPGEVLKVNRWHGGTEGDVRGVWGEDIEVSVNDFQIISRVYKPETTGPVSLYAVNTTTHEMFLLSKMEPDTKIPSYRRYRITNHGTTDDACSCVNALVKIRYRPARYTDDVMCIQNLSALKAMVMAIALENQKALAESQAFETQAIRLLEDDLGDEEQTSGTPIVLDYLQGISNGEFNRGYNV